MSMNGVLGGGAAARPARGAHTRPSWWSQVLVMGIGLFLYDWINNLSPVRQATAVGHGMKVLAVETRYHLDPELGLNRWLASHLGLGRISAQYYDFAHFTITLALLALIWWRHPRHFRFLRNSLAGMNAIGFVVFWAFPVAPPRMLPGFVDIVALTSPGTNLAATSTANQYAAMPSLHVAYAIWCAVAIWRLTEGWRTRDAGIALRALGVMHVTMTVLVILATGNHFCIDAIAGAATAGAALAGARLWARRAPVLHGFAEPEPEPELELAA